MRHVLFDANFWKSFVYARLAVPMGDTGCLALFGHDAGRHRLLAEHLTAEHRIRTQGRGRTVDEWRLRPAGFDNHWFDCLVGCTVAASMQGVALRDAARQTPAPRTRLRLSALRPSTVQTAPPSTDSRRR